MLRRPPRATRPDTLFPDTTLFRSRYSGCYGAPTMLTGLAFPRGVFGGVGIVESIAAPALSPTPPPNGSILNGWRGGGAGRGRLTNTCVSRSEEHTSELQSLMQISAVITCSKKQYISNINTNIH